MSDVLDMLELLESEGFGRRPQIPTVQTAAVPTPAVPLARTEDDGATLVARPAGFGWIRRCLQAQEPVPPLGAVSRLLGADPLGPDARHFLQLAREERRFAAALERPGWTTLHSLPTERDDDLDHLVVGPFGIMAISTVHPSGQRVRVDGRSLRLGEEVSRVLDRAAMLREDVASRLGVALGREVEVRSAVVVLGRGRIVVGARPDVPVLSPHQLTRLLWRLEPSFTPDETTEFADAARRASTWRDRASVAIAIPTEDAAFGELERVADAARRRRTVLESVGLAAIVSAMVGAASGAPAMIVAAVSTALGG
ncbi:MAG: NERD domain-containing protein [Micrococcales bacterium]|nr:NERD domain-containing protein [Micrococcales bacterium]